MSELAIAKLHPADDEPYLGTAFAVSKFLAITAFHCIGDLQTGQVLHPNVKLWWLGGDLRSAAEFVAGDTKLDYALYEIRPQLPDNYGLKPLGVARHALIGEEFRSIGFPAALDKNVVMPSILGTVSSYATTILDNVPAIQLYSEHAAARLKLAGFSGAPVIVGPNSDLAMGIIRWNPPALDHPGETQGGIVFATSLISILEQRPLFFRDVAVFHLQNLLGLWVWMPG